jgi:phosphopantothenoylcysteine decarboxylase/phosphopantothenate--cysteine ligase
MANGLADDLLSTTLLAARGTIVVAPAMNTRMYLNPVTQDNIRKIRERGVVIIDACEGALACRTEGAGRMAEPADIMRVIEREIAVTADLEGKRVLVTAGPTREYIDTVRFLSNPSTGLMGYTVADLATRRGATVTLISGPVDLACPAGVSMVEVVSAADMKSAVLEHIQAADALVMAAAVADFTPVEPVGKKMKKSDGIPELKFEATDDILKSLASVRNGVIIAGFAAETENVVENAVKKLADKDLDLIVANQVGKPGSGFGSVTDLAAVIVRGDTTATLEMMSKIELADLLLDRLSWLLRR